MADVQAQPRSFWDRPEGSFAKVFTPLVMIGGGISSLPNRNEITEASIRYYSDVNGSGVDWVMRNKRDA